MCVKRAVELFEFIMLLVGCAKTIKKSHCPESIAYVVIFVQSNDHLLLDEMENIYGFPYKKISTTLKCVNVGDE